MSGALEEPSGSDEIPVRQDFPGENNFWGAELCPPQIHVLSPDSQTVFADRVFQEGMTFK